MTAQPEFLYLGGRGWVIALDKRTGAEIWRTSIKTGWFRLGGSFVNLVEGAEFLFAIYSGHVNCLSKTDGSILWQQKVRDLGLSLISMAVDAGQLGMRGGSAPLIPTLIAAQQSAAASQTGAVGGPSRM